MKRILALLLALTFVFALSACNNQKDTESDIKATATQSETAVADTSSDTETQNSKPTTSSKPSDTTSAESSKPTENSNSEEASEPEVTSPTQESSEQTESAKPAQTDKSTEGTESETSKITLSTQSEHTHSYSDANCMLPKKCSCGATEGEPLGHKFEKLNCEYDICKRCGGAEPNGGKHDLKTSTYISCTKCDFVSSCNNSGDHTWEAATCTTPKHCTRCFLLGDDNRKALEHDFIKGSDEVLTCSRCKNKYCNLYGHTYQNNKCNGCGLFDIESQTLANSIISQIIIADMKDWERVLKIHDYLCETVTYDLKNYENHTVPKESYSVIGALKNQTAVCNGYALAFELLCETLGIECDFIGGTADNGDGSGYDDHAWNQVKLDNKWYNIDVTWDDPIIENSTDKKDYKSYDYFLISDSELYADHKTSEAKHTCSEGLEVIKICTDCENALSVNQNTCTCGGTNFKAYNN